MPVHYRYGDFPPDQRIDWSKLAPKLGPTAAALARFDETLGTIPDPNRLLASLTMNEAVISSRIEGIHATMLEVFSYEAGQEPRSSWHREDILEILNYRAALDHAVPMLKTLPLSGRIMREAHGVLLRGDRGRSLSPGQYRNVPNWIGCSPDIAEAIYIPVAVNRLQESMAAWERYIHADTYDRLVQVAVMHAEFEAIHPFMDGNSRMGRMLVPMFFYQKNMIQAPTFYVSAFLDNQCEAYYEGLLAVSRDDDWTGWCGFFLDAIRKQAEDDLRKVRRVFDLYTDMTEKLPEKTRSRHTVQAVEWIFHKPVFRRADFRHNLGLSESSARGITRLMVREGILRTIPPEKGRRMDIFAFQKLLEIAEGKELSFE